MSTQGVFDLATLQKKAVSDFERLCVPTRKDEDWKYTPTDALVRHAFKPYSNTALHYEISAPHELKGIHILPIKAAVSQYADLMQCYLGQIMPTVHGFHAQNLAFFEDGFFIYVPDGIKISVPLYLKHQAKQAGAIHCLRHLIILGKSSELNIIDSYAHDLDAPYFMNTMTEVLLDAGAKFCHLKVQRESLQAFHVGELAVKQLAESRFESHSVSLGALWARSDTTVELAAAQASCLMNGIYLPAGKQHVDHHTTVKHLAPGCVSTQDYKGIVKDHARAVFNGKVCVSQGASKTEARQYNKNLLLSSEAEVNTKAELQIFTDDVVCAHGATVGQLDEEALFYFATRGIDGMTAQHYLMRAFLTQNLQHMHALGGDALDNCVIERMACA